jgi:hypothetical protein
MSRRHLDVSSDDMLSDDVLCYVMRYCEPDTLVELSCLSRHVCTLSADILDQWNALARATYDDKQPLVTRMCWWLDFVCKVRDALDVCPKWATFANQLIQSKSPTFAKFEWPSSSQHEDVDASLYPHLLRFVRSMRRRMVVETGGALTSAMNVRDFEALNHIVDSLVATQLTPLDVIATACGVEAATVHWEMNPFSWNFVDIRCRHPVPFATDMNATRQLALDVRGTVSATIRWTKGEQTSCVSIMTDGLAMWRELCADIAGVSKLVAVLVAPFRQTALKTLP